MATPNKGYPTLVTGSGVDTWGDTYNLEGWTRVDSNFAGITSKSLTNVNVTLTADESQNALLRLSGTLTGNVQITTASKGLFFVDTSGLTAGAFSVTVTNGVAGVVVPAAQRSTMFADATAGVRVYGVEPFASGTRILFQQTTVPTGWTKELNSTYADAAPRITLGSVTTGGTTAFSTVFTARTLNKNQLPDVTISIVDPSHVHTQVGYTETNSGGSGSSRRDDATTFSTGAALTGITAFINNAARGGVAQQTIDFAVKYVDFSIGQKN
jgi:hypothetical protein